MIFPHGACCLCSATLIQSLATSVLHWCQRADKAACKSCAASRQRKLPYGRHAAGGQPLRTLSRPACCCDRYDAPDASIRSELRTNQRPKGCVCGSGGASGIGKAVCQRLAAEHATVVVADLHLDPAKRVAEEIIQSGGTAEACYVRLVPEIRAAQVATLQ